MLTARTPHHVSYLPIRDARALVLDLLAQQERAGRLAIEHAALDMDARDFGEAWNALRDEGLACGVEGEPLRLTDAGRAAHEDAERSHLPAPAPLPPIKSALARRLALFGAHVAEVA